MDEPGAVVEHVDLGEFRGDGADRLRIGDIQPARRRALQVGQAVGVDVHGDDGRAFAQEGFGRRAPDPLRRRRHQGGLACQSHP